MVVGGCKTLPVWSELAVIHCTIALTLYLQAGTAQNKQLVKSTFKKPHIMTYIWQHVGGNAHYTYRVHIISQTHVPTST